MAVVAIASSRRGVFISDTLPDTAPPERARVETTELFDHARRFADGAALTAYLATRGEPAANWLAMTIP